MTEMVFFHPASRTLILTDLIFNLHRASSWVMRPAPVRTTWWWNWGPGWAT